MVERVGNAHYYSNNKASNKSSAAYNLKDGITGEDICKAYSLIHTGEECQIQCITSVKTFTELHNIPANLKGTDVWYVTIVT